MKKLATLLTALIILTTSNTCFADVIDNLNNLTYVQKQQISSIQQAYKNQKNEIENNISIYKNRIAKLKSDITKSRGLIDLGIGNYEKKLQLLESQKNVLEKEIDTKYKSILTSKQYKQYQTMQMFVQEKFSNFLNK